MLELLEKDISNESHIGDRPQNPVLSGEKISPNDIRLLVLPKNFQKNSHFQIFM